MSLEALKARLRERTPKDDDSPGCMMCGWLLQDLEANGGRLKGWNMDLFGKPIFPKSAELAHLKLEGIPFEESAL